MGIRLLFFVGLSWLWAFPAATRDHPWYAGTDTSGVAVVRSNESGSVLIESPEFPRGLWIHLRTETGEVLPDVYLLYRPLFPAPDPGRPAYGDEGERAGLSGIIVWGGEVQVRFTEIWIRPDGTPLRFTIKTASEDDLPDGIYYTDWRIDPTAESLLEPEERQLTGWDQLRDFLREHWPVNVKTSTRPTAISGNVDTLVDYLKETHRLSEPSLGEEHPIYARVFPQVVTRTENGGYYPTNLGLYIPLLADANLDRRVREQLGLLYDGDLGSITHLEEQNRRVFSLEGIQHLSGLRSLRLGSFEGNDLGPLANLTNLGSLSLGQGVWDGGGIEDVTPLENLTNMTHLKLYRNKISDIRPLEKMTNLDLLDLHNNQVTTLAPLANMANLRWLGMDHNKISDIGGLENLTKLRTVFLTQNQIKDLSPLENLIGLWTIILSWNQIEDVTPLENLINLSTIGLENNRIEDISPLVANAGLGEGDSVYLSYNPLNNQALIEHISALRARGTRVRYWTPPPPPWPGP